MVVFFFKQKTAYEIGTGDWCSDVCSSDLIDSTPGLTTKAKLLFAVKQKKFPVVGKILHRSLDRKSVV